MMLRSVFVNEKSDADYNDWAGFGAVFDRGLLPSSYLFLFFCINFFPKSFLTLFLLISPPFF